MKDNRLLLGDKDFNEYTAEEFLELVNLVIPNIFSFIHDYISKQNRYCKDYYDISDKDIYELGQSISMMPMDFSRAICLDFKDDALKIGKILVANMEE